MPTDDAVWPRRRRAGGVASCPAHRRGWRRALWAACLLLAPALTTAPVHATTADARALYREGTRALAELRYADARALLGEAVRLDPDFAGAWLDLALATYAARDFAQAEDLLDNLEARFIVPPALHGVIARLREQIARGLAAPRAATLWRWRRQLTAATGHDSNANAGLSYAELALTQPGGPVVLPVAPDQRARADNFVQAGVAVVAARPLAVGTLELGASVQGRRNAEVTDFDTAEWRAGASWTSAGPLGNDTLRSALRGMWQLRGTAEQLDLGGDALTRALVVGVGHLWRHDGCWPRLDLDLEQRRYPVAHSLDATYLWLGGAVTCPGGLGLGSRELSLQARAGQAIARRRTGAQARPGGDTRMLELTAAHRWSWSGWSGPQSLQVLVQWGHLRDQEGYSPLLESGARRRVDRYSWGVSWSAPLAPGTGWRVTCAVQRLDQRANLAPFELDGRIAQIGLERTW